MSPTRWNAEQVKTLHLKKCPAQLPNGYYTVNDVGITCYVLDIINNSKRIEIRTWRFDSVIYYVI